ncbi:type III secretion system gatekeeper subunit SctW [Chlamydia gallinacea]|uniref:Type III secretion system gatekeeper subunit SctW n=1 Tax=Chlamydia gallinacea TaxID=1457153 RepID=A0ABS7ISK3_9CHLA|nr:type III secretion system gatekeeper subunit SctW [Chlamydia gallinacea]MBX6680277.1 type III secretion system gatekeeper subunit SctW [Chlamydia gallinacea]MBX6687887.1 type III secretion system gatekeeper subunit SctW [Chlamydia gallinacea]
MAASGGAGGLGRANAIDVAQVQQAAATADAKEIIATQEQSSISLIKDNQDVSNPAAATRTKKKEEKFQTLESRRKGGAAQTEKKSEATEEKSDADLADKYTENNSEISAGDLRSIRDSLKNDASEDDILSLLQSKFSDPALQSIALDYLIQTTPNAQGALKDTLVRAQQRHTQQNHQAVVGGKNILFASQEYASALNVSAPSLRSLYLEVTSNFHTCDSLLQMLQSRYNYEEMATVSSFLLKGMSADLKSEGASIEPAKLQVLMTETRNLQAVISGYDFFQIKLPTLTASLKAEGVSLPEDLTFQKVGDTFFSLIGDKFPTASKMERAVRGLVGDDVDAVSSILNLFFTAIRGTSPRLFSSADKRQQLATMLANALDSVNINNENYPKPTDFPKPYPWS